MALTRKLFFPLGDLVHGSSFCSQKVQSFIKEIVKNLLNDFSISKVMAVRIGILCAFAIFSHITKSFHFERILKQI